MARRDGDVPVRKVEVTLDRFPKALSGFRIVQVTDLHVSPDTHVESVQRLVDRVNALKPDLVAVTGDLVDGSPEIRPLVAPLKGLHAPQGVFFVTGNHEILLQRQPLDRSREDSRLPRVAK